MPHEAEPASTTDSRAAVIQAAIDTILELGYYRASSNEIARRAGVTWGVIQYHFGTRENLLLSALRASIEAHAEQLRTAVIEGDTLADRLHSFGRVLHDHYGSEHFLAMLQIIVNLLRDPKTATGTIEAMESALAMAGDHAAALLESAAAPVELRPADRRLIFALFRGVALDDLLLQTMHPGLELDPDVDGVFDAVSHALGEYLTSRDASAPRRRTGRAIG